MKRLCSFAQIALLGSLAVVVVSAVCACSAEHSAGAQTSSVVTSNVTSSTGVPGAPLFDKAFVELASALDPIPAFGLAELSAGTTVASNWWPVIEGGSQAGSGESSANPHVEGLSPNEASGQVLLTSDGGWLVVIANFRGDLGDVSGERVGSIAGRPAYLYEVNGGWLVQWSYDGRWYGLFGRGVPRDVVASTALGMTLIEQY